MCHGPHDPQQLMRDMARRTEGLTAPRWSFGPLLAALARGIRALSGWMPARGVPDLRPAPVRRDRR